MVRRIGLVLVVCCLGLATLAYPKSINRTVAQDSETTVSYFAYIGGPEHRLWDIDNIAVFDEMQDGITIEYRTADMYDNVIPIRYLDREITSDSPPDVVSGWIGGGVLQNYIEAGYIADISDLWEAMGWYDNYPQSVIDMASYEGKQYFVPMAFQWTPVFYRTDVFESVGISPPQTWDELLSTCEILSEAGYIPFTVAATGWNAPILRWFTTLNLRLNGADYHAALMRGDVPYDERVRDIFTYWQEAYEHHCFAAEHGSIDYAAAIGHLRSGEAAMYMNGEWMFENLSSEEIEMLDFFSFPTLKPAVPHAELVHYYGAFMLAGSDEPQAALELLRYLGGSESQTSNAIGVNRAVATNAIDRSILPTYQVKGIEFISNAEALVPLFEVSNLNHSMANRGLNLISLFFRSLGDTDRLESTVEHLEAERLEQIGGE